MKSGVVKQKWTADEEAALRAGVEKYGAGKWRAIQKDANFGACLISRSNVDLKDKWRNMSVSANGLGSRDRATRILASKMKQGEVMSAKGQLGADTSMIDSFCASGVADGEEVVGARFDNLILEAILKLQGANGGSKGQIASYLEKHYPVPYHFRRLLAAKLKALTQQGKLIKIRRHYSMTQDGEQEEYHGLGLKTAAQSDCETSEDADIVYKLKNMSANEVAMMAAQAVADAEVAAAAAEEAARVAEIAEAEWEAAESAAHMAAALAMRRSRRF